MYLMNLRLQKKNKQIWLMKRLLFLISLVLLPSVCCVGQNRADKLTPRWMRSTVSSRSSGIRYVSVTVPNPSSRNVSAEALDQLSRNIQKDWTISQSVRSNQTDMIQRENGQLSGSERIQISTVEIIADGEPVTVNCMLADEWWGQKSGIRTYCALYQVAESSLAIFDKVYPTNDYGFSPMIMSIIPGMGQFYKGDPLKGSLILGGCAVTGVGAVFLESQRKACKDQMSQTHDINLIKKYSADERNYGIARNVTIGAFAALYVYNLVDAVIAPGARKVKVTPGGVSINF